MITTKGGTENADGNNGEQVERNEAYDHDVYRTLADILDVDVNSLRNENEEFVTSAKEQYGQRGALQAETLIENAHALFAGGSLSDADKDKLMLALQED